MPTPSPSPPPPPQTGIITHLPSASSPLKTLFTTANPFEQRFRYHRAVRRGPFIFVSGTTALKDAQASPTNDAEGSNDGEEPNNASKVHHPTDAGQQARVVMERCVDAVRRLGGTRGDVVRVRMFVARNEDCLAVGEAFRDCFGGVEGRNGEGGAREEGDEIIGAAATMVVIKDGFVDPDVLVEVEVDAVVWEG